MAAGKDRLGIERNLWRQGYKRIMGLDEVGRGCLSGPVVAAGVILSPNSADTPYQDSKSLSEAGRLELDRKIRDEALYYTIQYCDPREVDRLNILKASIQAMIRCAESGGAPDFLLVDGNRFADTLLPCQCIIGGDNRSATIAAASILAKVYRDRLMRRLHEEYPQYGWNRNVGYPTRKHYEALKEFGYTRYHRKSFNLKTDRPFAG